MGISTISMAIFNSYFDITRGYITLAAQVFQAFGLETLAMRSRRTADQSGDGGMAMAMKETAGEGSY